MAEPAAPSALPLAETAPRTAQSCAGTRKSGEERARDCPRAR